MQFTELSLSIPKNNITQTITVGAAASAQSAALSQDYAIVSVVGDPVFALAGTNPTASVASLHLPVGIYRVNGWSAGDKLAFYSVAGSTVYVTSGL